MLLLIAVLTCSAAGRQCHAQPTSATAATVDAVTPAPTITDTPTVIPEMSHTPGAISDGCKLDAYPALQVEIAGQVVEVTPVSAEQILQFQQWEKQNADASRRSTLAWYGFWGAVIALMFAGWRATSHYNQVHEQMMTSFRERLFSKDPGAVIAAAMSLSAYPREAIWLVMRWSEEHKREKLEGVFYKDPHQIKQAIQDALSNMSKRHTWTWKKWDWPKTSKYLGAFFRFITRKGKGNSFEKFFQKLLRHLIIFPRRVHGARLEGKTISIDIGPINLNNAYMVGGDFSGIGLEDADLSYANLQHSYFDKAKLKHINFGFANLQKTNFDFADMLYADISYANLLYANLGGVKLQYGFLWDANLQHVYLCYANLNGAYVREIELQNSNLEDDYLSYAQNMGAILDDEQKQKVMEWEKDHPDAPWLNAIPCWWVYMYLDDNKMNQIQNDWTEEMGEYIDKTRGGENPS